MAIGDKHECPGCGHQWHSRVRDPVECPRCKCRLHPRQRGGNPKGRCPLCRRRVALMKNGVLWAHKEPGVPGDDRPACEGSGLAVEEIAV